MQAVEGPSLDTHSFLPVTPPPHGAPPPLQPGRISGLVRPKISHRTCGTFCPTHPIAPCQPSCSARPGRILYVQHMDDGELYCRACFRYQGTGPLTWRLADMRRQADRLVYLRRNSISSPRSATRWTKAKRHQNHARLAILSPGHWSVRPAKRRGGGQTTSSRTTRHCWPCS